MVTRLGTCAQRWLVCLWDEEEQRRCELFVYARARFPGSGHRKCKEEKEERLCVTGFNPLIAGNSFLETTAVAGARGGLTVTDSHTLCALNPTHTGSTFTSAQGRRARSDSLAGRFFVSDPASGQLLLASLERARTPIPSTSTPATRPHHIASCAGTHIPRSCSWSHCLGRRNLPSTGSSYSTSHHWYKIRTPGGDPVPAATASAPAPPLLPCTRKGGFGCSSQPCLTRCA